MDQQPQIPGERAPMQAPQPAVSKWLWITLIIVVLIAGAYFTYYYFLGPVKSQLFFTPNPPPTTTTTTTTPTTTTVSATADWKTYTNTAYGFSIKYPANITPEVTDSGKNIAFSTSEDKANYDKCIAAGTSECLKLAPLVISINNSADGKTETWKLSLDEIMNTVMTNNNTVTGVKTTLASQPAYEFVNNGMISNYEIMAKSGDNLLELVFGSTDATALVASKAMLTETQKNLISTFQFMK